jgi:ketosteroid isomerase-like protein
LNKHTIDRLSEIYSENIVFIDPAHKITGLVSLKDYFARLYDGLDAIEFDFTHQQRHGDVAYVEWLMVITHPRLRKGRPVRVAGVSRLEFDSEDKVKMHRDYFDMGEMLYENLPLIGKVITSIKKRLGQ